MVDAVPLVLSRRSADVLLDMIDNRLTSVESVDREDARTVHDLTQAKRALQEAKRCGKMTAWVAEQEALRGLLEAGA